MAWKVLSNLKTDVLHKAGEILQELTGVAEEEIQKLEKEGIIKNLETDAEQDAGKVEDQAKTDVHTAEEQLDEDAELARGQADDQVADHVNQDVTDAEQLANEPGTPVVPAGQPSAADIANDPQLQ